jgi:hypothetical protein
LWSEDNIRRELSSFVQNLVKNVCREFPYWPFFCCFFVCTLFCIEIRFSWYFMAYSCGSGKNCTIVNCRNNHKKFYQMWANRSICSYSDFNLTRIIQSLIIENSIVLHYFNTYFNTRPIKQMFTEVNFIFLNVKLNVIKEWCPS